MNVKGTAFRSIWLALDGYSVEVIDQRRLPHEFTIQRLDSLEDAEVAIRDMVVRGAPLIGATAAYGVALAMRADASDSALEEAYARLLGTRPTAVNLRWALDVVRGELLPLPREERVRAAYAVAGRICDEDVEINRLIGEYGFGIFQEIAARKGKGKSEALNILTHCNAGWIATVDWGTALAPVYMAHDAGLRVHVWVDETRPRNQGASLTAWELGNHGVPHTLIVDNAGGHLMQHGLVDVCIVGTDRTTACGDVCNKIGTYLKALAARDNGVPFYVALPSSTIDWSLRDGVKEIPIEEREGREVTHVRGLSHEGEVVEVAITTAETRAGNYGFDVTPARLVSGLITERGVCEASEAGLRKLFGRN
jgi:methylthioribose-1-phosphate isomerase